MIIRYLCIIKMFTYIISFIFLSEHKYTISTYTGSERGAGTDANVFITLFSKNGNSAEMKLNDSKNNFEKKKYVPQRF